MFQHSRPHVLATQMPHYHAEEATRAIKPILGDYYTWDNREVLSLHRACRKASSQSSVHRMRQKVC